MKGRSMPKSRYQPRASSKPGPRLPGNKKPQGKAAKNAQPAYVLKVAVPKRSANALPTSDTIAQLQAMAQAGLLPGMTSRAAAAADGGFDIVALLRLYAEFRPQIDRIRALLQSLGLFKKDAKPVPVPDPTPGPEPTPDEIDGPDEATGREVGKLEAKVFWIARKNQPHKAGGGRYLLDDAGKQRIVAGSDPLQSGDRVCVDLSPYDKQGRKFEGEKPVPIEHHVGGVGELQQQEEQDHTPVILCPWQGEAGQPGFHGEITYYATGGGLTSNTIKLRVRPWA